MGKVVFFSDVKKDGIACIPESSSDDDGVGENDDYDNGNEKSVPTFLGVLVQLYGV